MRGPACLVLAAAFSLAPTQRGRDEPQPSSPPISLSRVTFAQWKRQLEQWRGRVVVVDLWATWCLPCLERFPHMVDLYRRYAPRGVRFVSLSLDDREDRESLRRARDFLLRQGAVFENFLMDENVVEAFEKLDLLGIPAVFVYDRAGRLAYRLTGDDPNHQFTDQDVEEAIRSLLGERGK